MKLLERATGLLWRPAQEWRAIAAEETSVQSLYTEYVMVLAAIPALAAFVGASFVGYGGWGFGTRAPLGPGIASMVLTYALWLGAVYALALVIDALAPSFAGERDFVAALKVAAFAPTATWVAGAFYVVPVLAILAIVGAVYSLYLLYAGLAHVMEVPEDKAVPYAVVVILAAIVMMVIISTIASLPLPAHMRGF